jgi:hypothetical protein
VVNGNAYVLKIKEEKNNIIITQIFLSVNALQSHYHRIANRVEENVYALNYSNIKLEIKGFRGSIKCSDKLINIEIYKKFCFMKPTDPPYGFSRSPFPSRNTTFLKYC